MPEGTFLSPAFSAMTIRNDRDLERSREAGGAFNPTTGAESAEFVNAYVGGAKEPTYDIVLQDYDVELLSEEPNTNTDVFVTQTDSEGNPVAYTIGGLTYVIEGNPSANPSAIPLPLTDILELIEASDKTFRYVFALVNITVPRNVKIFDIISNSATEANTKASEQLYEYVANVALPERVNAYNLKKEQVRNIRANDLRYMTTSKEDGGLGVPEEDAVAVLQAYGSLHEASRDMAEYIGASPSAREAMIARDSLDGNILSEDSFQASALRNIPFPPILNLRGEHGLEDPMDGIRKPYAEKTQFKPLIQIVSQKETQARSRREIAETNNLRRTANKYIQKYKDQTGLSNLDQFKTSILGETLIREFMLQSVTELDSERFQILETFNHPLVYFFGRRARVFNYSIAVENNANNLWKDRFKSAYDRVLRGTKCVENRVKILLQYDTVSRLGYMLNCSMQMDSNNDNIAYIAFTMFVEDESYKVNFNSKLIEQFANQEAEREQDRIRRDATAQDVLQQNEDGIFHVDLIPESFSGTKGDTVESSPNESITLNKTLEADISDGLESDIFYLGTKRNPTEQGHIKRSSYTIRIVSVMGQNGGDMFDIDTFQSVSGALSLKKKGSEKKINRNDFVPLGSSPTPLKVRLDGASIPIAVSAALSASGEKFADVKYEIIFNSNLPDQPTPSVIGNVRLRKFDVIPILAESDEDNAAKLVNASKNAIASQINSDVHNDARIKTDSAGFWGGYSIKSEDMTYEVLSSAGSSTTSGGTVSGNVGSLARFKTSIKIYLFGDKNESNIANARPITAGDIAQSNIPESLAGRHWIGAKEGSGANSQVKKVSLRLTVGDDGKSVDGTLTIEVSVSDTANGYWNVIANELRLFFQDIKIAGASLQIGFSIFPKRRDLPGTLEWNLQGGITRAPFGPFRDQPTTAVFSGSSKTRYCDPRIYGYGSPSSRTTFIVKSQSFIEEDEWLDRLQWGFSTTLTNINNVPAGQKKFYLPQGVNRIGIGGSATVAAKHVNGRNPSQELYRTSEPIWTGKTFQIQLSYVEITRMQRITQTTAVDMSKYPTVYEIDVEVNIIRAGTADIGLDPVEEISFRESDPFNILLSLSGTNYNAVLKQRIYS